MWFFDVLKITQIKIPHVGGSLIGLLPIYKPSHSGVGHDRALGFLYFSFLVKFLSNVSINSGVKFCTMGRSILHLHSVKPIGHGIFGMA